MDKGERQQRLRRAFGTFMTGVTVMTMMSREGYPLGFTANSFTSVSLDPMLLLVCLGTTSSHLSDFESSEYFGVNILAEDQMDLSETFASEVTDRFEGVSWQSSKGEVPILAGVVTWFVCRTKEVIMAGDHNIIVGEVEDFGENDADGKEGLGYYRGKYFTLSKSDVS